MSATHESTQRRTFQYLIAWLGFSIRSASMSADISAGCCRRILRQSLKRQASPTRKRGLAGQPLLHRNPVRIT
jgi:hypothetical protein